MAIMSKVRVHLQLRREREKEREGGGRDCRCGENHVNGDLDAVLLSAIYSGRRNHQMQCIVSGCLININIASPEDSMTSFWF